MAGIASRCHKKNKRLDAIHSTEDKRIVLLRVGADKRLNGALVLAECLLQAAEGLNLRPGGRGHVGTGGAARSLAGEVSCTGVLVQEARDWILAKNFAEYHR